MALAATGELEGWKTGASALSRPWLPLENEDRVADDVSGPAPGMARGELEAMSLPSVKLVLLPIPVVLTGAGGNVLSSSIFCCKLVTVPNPASLSLAGFLGVAFAMSIAFRGGETMACNLLPVLLPGWVLAVGVILSSLFWFEARFLLFLPLVLADLVDSPTELPALETLAEVELGTVKVDLFELRRDCCLLTSPVRGLLL